MTADDRLPPSDQPLPEGARRGSRWGPLWPLGEALRFLTILPTPGLPPPSGDSIARSIAWFPLAGAIIGTLLAAIGLGVGLLWGPGVRAVLLVIAWAIVTAGLHLDGLSDTFDAVVSWRPRERKLEIMKDSRIGAMGAIALFAVLALKAALIGAVGDGWLRAIWLAPILGRWATVYAICMFPPARSGGLGHSYQSQVGRSSLVFSTFGMVICALALGGARGLIAAALIWLLTQTLARWWTRALGGLTGDTYGALCELAEAATLAVLTASL
jgi:adenosylcobinamide-GDP ribazoletransferase